MGVGAGMDVLETDSYIAPAKICTEDILVYILITLLIMLPRTDLKII